MITLERVLGDFSLPPTPTQLVGKLSFDSYEGVSGGMMATIGHYLGRDENNRDEFVEFTFWGLDQWHNAVATTSNEYIDLGPLPRYPQTTICTASSPS